MWHHQTKLQQYKSCSKPTRLQTEVNLGFHLTGSHEVENGQALFMLGFVSPGPIVLDHGLYEG